MPAQHYSTDEITYFGPQRTQCIAINMTVQIRCCKKIMNLSGANIIGISYSIQNETGIDVTQETDTEKKLDSCRI
jgi:hypothetical protein